MKKTFGYAAAILPGAAFGALAVILARLLIQNSGALAAGIAGLAGAKAGTAEYIGQILGQLRGAEIGSPWAIFIAAGAVIWAIPALRMRKKRAMYVLWAVLLIPGMIAAVCLTEVNGILTFALLRRLLPVAAGLF